MNNRISIATIDSPEFINLQTMDINPLMSKCDIKVLYVGQNRNRSCITKEVATEMSKTLRGCPIVGYYIENKEDFGDHGDQVIIDGEGIKFNKLTKPYGFVAPDAKVWFQFFEDEDEFGNAVVREYLMTEGYLWTGQFEECKRVLENNNPQSMELDEKTLKGYWSTDNNQGVDFFIINDAIFSKLCILGDDVEPCFEGASVGSPNISSNFNKNNDFTKSLFEMMSELKYTLNNNKGGNQMANIENVLGNDNETESFENQSNIEAPIVAFEDAAAGDGGDAEGESTSESEDAEGDETATIEAQSEIALASEPLTTPNDIVLNETDEKIIDSVTEDYIPEGETAEEAVLNDGATNVPTKILQSAKADEEKKDKEDKSDSQNSENNTEDKKDEEEEKKKNFALEFENLKKDFEALKAERDELFKFKQKVEEKEKDELIASFYMLSDEDKADVVKNKANYSLKEIKAELSMICVDKKVIFTKEDTSAQNIPTTYNFGAVVDNTPEWLRKVEETRNKK